MVSIASAEDPLKNGENLLKIEDYLHAKEFFKNILKIQNLLIEHFLDLPKQIIFLETTMKQQFRLKDF